MVRSHPFSPGINIFMITLLGSSYTRGAWGDHMDQPQAMLHTLLSDALECDVMNMSMPGHGSEMFVNAYIYACSNYKPKLFLAELVEDRSLRLLSVPNETTKYIATLPCEEVYEHSFQHGMDGEPYITNHMGNYHVHNSAGDDPAEHAIFATSNVEGFDLKEVLNWLNYLRLFHEDDSLRLMRSIRHFVTLEKLSRLVGVPVLYYRHTNWTDIEDKFSGTVGDRYLNAWHGLDTGVADWVNKRMDGKHLADNTHLNLDADKIVVNELMAPFIRHHLGS